LLNSDISNRASLGKIGWTTVNNEKERIVAYFNIRKFAWGENNTGASFMRIGVEADIQNTTF
jgi:hypothetical protein